MLAANSDEFTDPDLEALIAVHLFLEPFLAVRTSKLGNPPSITRQLDTLGANPRRFPCALVASPPFSIAKPQEMREVPFIERSKESPKPIAIELK